MTQTSVTRTSPLDIAIDYSERADPVHRANACMALAEIGSAEAIDRLIALAKPPQPPEVQKAATNGLIQLVADKKDPDGRVVAAVVHQIKNGDDQELRRHAMMSALEVSALRRSLIETFKTVSREDRDPLFRREVQQRFLDLAENDPQAVEIILESAVTEVDPGLRNRAVRAIERVRRSGQTADWRWDIAKVDTAFYGWLAKARQMGLFRPALQGGWRARLAAVGESARAAGPRGASASWRPVVVALIVSLFAILPLWALVGYLAAQPLDNMELVAFGALALLSAIVFALAALLPARPLARSADRTAAAVLEIRTAGIAGAALGLLIGLTVQLGRLTMDSALVTPPGTFVLEVIASILALAVTLVLLRGLTIAAYGLVASAAWRVGLTLAAGLFASVSLTALVVWLAGPVGAMASTLDLSQIAFVIWPALLGLVAGYLAVDLTIDDALPQDTAAWRWLPPAALTLGGMAALGLVLLGHQHLADDRTFASALRDSADGALDREVLLLADTDYRLTVEDGRPTAISLRLPRREIEAIVRPDDANSWPFSGLRPVDDGAQTGFFQPGSYTLRFASRSSTATNLALDAATGSILRFAGHGMARFTAGEPVKLVAADVSAGRLLDVALTFNARNITNEDFEQAGRIFGELSGSRPEKGASAEDEKRQARNQERGEWRYAVVLDEGDQPYALGSLLAYYHRPGVPEFAYLPAVAWERDTTRAVRSEGLALLPARPSKWEIAEYEILNKVMAEDVGHRQVSSLLGSAITASEGEISGPVELVHGLVPLTGTPGRFAVYSGGDPGSPVAVGTLLRQTEIDQAGMPYFELIGGAATAAAPPFVFLRRDSVLEVASPDYAAAFALAEDILRLPVERPEEIHVDLPLPQELPAVPNLGPSPAMADLRERQGQMPFDTSGPEPEEFRHHFMVMESMWFEPGDIVRGKLWDNSGAPQFAEVYPGDDEWYEQTEALTYLGAEYDPTWEELSRLVRQGEDAMLPALERLVPDLSSRTAQFLERKGKWLADFGISPTGAEPPEFRHYFMLVNDGQIFGAGSILRGRYWDRSDWPEFDLIYGWGGSSRSSAYEYLSTLTYLGPDYDPAWETIAADVRRSQGLSPESPRRPGTTSSF